MSTRPSFLLGGQQPISADRPAVTGLRTHTHKLNPSLPFSHDLPEGDPSLFSKWEDTSDKINETGTPSRSKKQRVKQRSSVSSTTLRYHSSEYKSRSFHAHYLAWSGKAVLSASLNETVSSLSNDLIILRRIILHCLKGGKAAKACTRN